ncbi:NlpC/P60 family protein, partial [Persephonella sp.]|uniref:NlpC/P60 family protein n=1 Tax=Persephonella sp. TaxID=2060922 RepID=UPI0025EA43AC
MRLIVFLLTVFFMSTAVLAKDLKIFESDYYNSLNVKYAKDRYMAVMIDDGIPAVSIQKSVVDFAIGLLGIRYRFGGETIWGMDCSAFVQKVYS